MQLCQRKWATGRTDSDLPILCAIIAQWTPPATSWMASNNDHLLLRILWGGTMGGLSTDAQFCIPRCQRGSWPDLGMRKGLSLVWGLGRAGGWGPSSSSTQLLPPLGFSSPGTLLVWPLLQQETGLFTWWLTSQRATWRLQDFLRPMPRTNSSNSYFLTSCYVRKITPCMFELFPWGILFCGWIIPFGCSTKGWLICGLVKLSSPDLFVVSF